MVCIHLFLTRYPFSVNYDHVKRQWFFDINLPYKIIHSFVIGTFTTEIKGFLYNKIKEERKKKIFYFNILRRECINLLIKVFSMQLQGYSVSVTCMH